MKKSKTLLILSLAALGLAGCNPAASSSSSSPSQGSSSEQSSSSISNSESTSEKIAVSDITLSASSLSMMKGETQTIVATVSPENATDKSLTFASDNEAVATVSNAGVVTAVSKGSATITVSSVSNPAISKTVAVTVSEPVAAEGLEVKLQETVVTETEDLTGGDKITKFALQEGSDYHLVAAISPSDATQNKVVYEVEPGREDNLTIDEDGTVHALKVWARIKVTATIEGTSIKQDIYFAVYSAEDMALKKLYGMEQTTKAAEAEKAVKEVLKIEDYDNGVVDETDTITASIYSDEVYEVRYNDSYSPYSYKRHRYIDDGSLVDIKLDYDNGELTEYESTPIDGETLTEEEAKFNSSTIYYSSNNGISGILYNDFLSASEMGGNEAIASYKITDENGKMTIDAAYETGQWFTTYYIQRMEITYDENLVIKQAIYRTAQYNSDPYNDDGTLNGDVYPSSERQYTLTLELGERTASPNKISLDDFYYTDFTPKFTGPCDEYYVGKTYKLGLESFAPSTASELVDKVKITEARDIEGTNVVTIDENGQSFTVNSKGKVALTVASKNVTKVVEITTDLMPIQSIEIDYDGATSLMAGQTSGYISANVSPYDASDTSYTASIIEGSEYATLNDEGSGYYSLTINEGATEGQGIVVEFKTNAVNAEGQKLTDTIEFTVSKPLEEGSTLDVITSTKWLYADEANDDYYYITFNKDGTGLFENIWEGDPWANSTFTYHVEGLEIIVDSCEGDFEDMVGGTLSQDGSVLTFKYDTYYSAQEFVPYSE